MIDTASNGAQVAYWSIGNTDGPRAPLMVAVRGANGFFRNAQQLDFRVPPQEVDVAIAPNGAAHVAWGEWNESTTEDGESPTPEYSPSGRILTSYRPPKEAFGEPRAFRPDPEPAQITGLSTDVDSRGTAIMSFGANRFAGIQRRGFTAVQYEGDEPEAIPMTGFDEGGSGRADIDERGRTVMVGATTDRVLGRRGAFRRYASGSSTTTGNSRSVNAP